MRCIDRQIADVDCPIVRTDIARDRNVIINAVCPIDHNTFRHKLMLYIRYIVVGYGNNDLAFLNLTVQNVLSQRDRNTGIAFQRIPFCTVAAVHQTDRYSAGSPVFRLDAQINFIESHIRSVQGRSGVVPHDHTRRTVCAVNIHSTRIARTHAPAGSRRRHFYFRRRRSEYKDRLRIAQAFKNQVAAFRHARLNKGCVLRSLFLVDHRELVDQQSQSAVHYNNADLVGFRFAPDKIYVCSFADQGLFRVFNIHFHISRRCGLVCEFNNDLFPFVV